MVVVTVMGFKDAGFVLIELQAVGASCLLNLSFASIELANPFSFGRLEATDRGFKTF